MSHSMDSLRNLSLKVSEVLSDIGVNQRLVKKRKRIWLTNEAAFNIRYKSLKLNTEAYVFGSQVEGSTTPGLHSDLDLLICTHGIILLQQWSEWQQQEKLQLLMLKDERTYPGHCLLQIVQNAIPLPAENIQHEDVSTNRGRVLLRHSACLLFNPEGVRHGPANRLDRNCYETDNVVAFKCPTWPKEAEPWLQNQTESGWPSEDIKRTIVGYGCFVVPVASKTGVYPDLEWRISTAEAERYLMFRLNVMHIKCYILLKMILKTFLKPVCGDAISSYICKTVVFYSVARSQRFMMDDSDLLIFLTQCIELLRIFILTENCPHFIIKENNLLAGRLTVREKQQVLDILCNFTENISFYLNQISADNFGYRLQVRINNDLVASGDNFGIDDNQLMETCVDLTEKLADINFKGIFLHIRDCSNKPQLFDKLRLFLETLMSIYPERNSFYRSACALMTTRLCTHIGCMLASADIEGSGTVSPQALCWFAHGLNSDMASSRLKLASTLYCAGEIQRCETVLTDLQRRFVQKPFMHQCYCYPHTPYSSKEFASLCYNSDDEVSVIKQNISSCVIFLPVERNCIPVEMKYEFFRSTQEDLFYRGKGDTWMDLAVVDSLPFLFFLQYKVYSQLHRPVDQVKALLIFACIVDSAYILYHKETTLNLLGQIMEQENKPNMALKFYRMSLNVRSRNNVAKWHVGRLLASHVASNVQNTR